jgi:nucleotide-binding universal stress UspA family protein
LVEKLDRIGVGVDLGDDEPSDALRAAGVLARRAKAGVDLVHVVHLPPLYNRVVSPIQSSLREPDGLIAKLGEKLAGVAADPALAGLDVRCHLPVGVPHAGLISCCRAQGDDVIVIGAPRRGAVGRLLLGRTAERTLRNAPIPVLVAKRQLAEAPGVILAATDFSTASRPALEEAVVLARSFAARLVLIHVMEPVAHLYGWAADLAGGDVYLVEPHELEPEWESLMSDLDIEGIACEHVTEKGDPVQVIALAAESFDADIIVLGTHGRSALAHALLGSVAEGVARHAERSVMTVRSAALPFEVE